MRRTAMMLVALCAVCMIAMADGKLAGDLEQKLITMRDNERVPVMVLYEGTPSFAEVAREYRFLGAQEVVREQAIRVMKENAESLHYWLRQMCETSAMADQVGNFTSIWIVNAVALEATPAAIREIAAQPNVAKVVLDEPVPMLFENEREMTWGIQKINAPAAWKYNMGEGVVVAVVDTGVNEHPDLKGRVVDGRNYINSGVAPRDDHGHGTHCAGTVAGDGANGTQTGVAPKATIVAVKVLAANGSGAWSNLYLAIEEAVQSKAKVVSMSLGGFPTQDIRDRLRLACRNAIAAGVIPVIAAGNSGSQGIGAPGDVPEVITIGATDSSDKIAYFSSRGPAKWGTESIVKPDVSAPGVAVKSCSYNSGGYTDMSGTSMATPHVAGVVALLCNANPSLTTEKAKAALEQTATDLGPAGKDNDYGSGRVNADRALVAVQSLNRLEDDRFEMVVKEMFFETMVDASGNLYIQQTMENEILPATVTVWVKAQETYAQKGVYDVNFTLSGPNGTKTGNVKINYDNIPTDPNKYDPKYGFNVGNFEMVQGQYTGTVKSNAPNPKVQSVKVTIHGQATWPARTGK